MTETDLRARVAEAATALGRHLGERGVRTALILGSGLSAGSLDLDDSVTIPLDELPQVPAPSVEGHRPDWMAGMLSGEPVVVAGGRVHGYEGRPLWEITLGVRVLAAAGCERLVITNAAGGIRDDLEPGTLMRIRDHINLLGDSPLVGVSPGEGIGERFVDMSVAYDADWGARGVAAARELGVPLAEGVYACCLGPQYETPAEIGMLERLGADAVGMSTVPEVIVARQCGLQVFGLSLISNRAAGRSAGPLSHQEVIEAGRRAQGDLVRLLTQVVTARG